MMTVQEGVCPDGVFILCLVSFLAQGYAFFFFTDFYSLRESRQCTIQRFEL